MGEMKIRFRNSDSDRVRNIADAIGNVIGHSGVSKNSDTIWIDSDKFNGCSDSDRATVRAYLDAGEYE